MNAEKLYELLDDEQRTNNPFYTAELDPIEQRCWEKFVEICKDKNKDIIDSQNDFHDFFAEYVCAVQKNAFLVGYRTAQALIIRP